MKKKLSILLLCAIALCLTAACGSDAAEPAFDEVESAIDSAVDTSSMTEADSSYLQGMFGLEEGDYEACRVLITGVGTTIDEIGLFKGADAAQAEELKTAVTDYLQLRLNSWMPEYLPDEFPKLQNARLYEQGTYVFYAILSDEGRDAALEAFEGCF
mgnify:FL=1